MMLLNEASHALTTEMAAGLADIGITPREYCVLAKAEGGHDPARDRGQAGIDKTTMVVTVDQLERAGLAQRLPDPTDRRARIVGITPRDAGAGAGRRGGGRHLRRRAGDAPDGERAGMVAALQRLVEGDGRLSTPVGPGDAPCAAKNLPT